MPDTASVLKELGGISVDKKRSPFLHDKIDRLSLIAKINKPDIYLIPEKTPNACAVATSDQDTAVAVTTGLLSELDEYEIEAVLAHEIGHIQSGHSIQKTKVAMKALAISTLASVAGYEVATSDIDFTPGDDNDDDLASTIIKVVIGSGVGVAGDIAGSTMLTQVSFASEFEADQIGGTISKKPWALANALRRIESLTRNSQLSYEPEVEQLFIVSPSYVDHKTHPPTSDRIDKLLTMSNNSVSEVCNVPTCFYTHCGQKTDLDGSYCYWCGGQND